MRAGLGLLDSELEPDSSGKSYLVNTVPQSGEASELHAASLEAKPTEPKVLVEVGELLESCWRVVGEEKASVGTDNMTPPSALSWLLLRSLRAPSEGILCWQNSSLKSKQLVGAPP